MSWWTNSVHAGEPRAAVGLTRLRDLLRSIFLDAGLRDGPGSGRFPLAKAAGVAAFVLFLTILRKPASVVIPPLWADDGPAFFQQALESGFATLLIAHGGYYHTVIRLVALLGTLLPEPLLAGPFGGSGIPAFLLGVLAIALLAFVAWRLRTARKGKALYLSAAGMSVVASALYVARGVPETLYSVWSQDRFFFVPLVILMWSLIQTLDTKGRGRYVSVALLLIAAVRTVGQPSLSIFEMKDLHWAEASRCIGGPAPCTILINPPGWYVRYEPRKP
jgi:hypothetical protein